MVDTVVVGKSVVRTDAAAKARGGAIYGVDVRFGGMLVGKTLRAGIPHARIVNVDTSAAAKVPGVRAIVTGQDCSRRHGLFQKDQRHVRTLGVNHFIFRVQWPGMPQEDALGQIAQLGREVVQRIPSGDR